MRLISGRVLDDYGRTGVTAMIAVANLMLAAAACLPSAGIGSAHGWTTSISSAYAGFRAIRSCFVQTKLVLARSIV
jgi:hypothetical protein